MCFSFFILIEVSVGLSVGTDTPLAIKTFYEGHFPALLCLLRRPSREDKDGCEPPFYGVSHIG